METEKTSLYTQYKELDTKYKKDFKTFTWRGKEIKISNYLPIDEKISLINITIQKAMNNGLIHPLFLKKHYELNLVYAYTDIIFTDEDRADEGALYDSLYCSGLLNEVIKNIHHKEIECLARMLDQTVVAMKEHKTSAVGVIETLFTTFYNEIPKVMDALNDVNPETATQILQMIQQKKE